MRDPLSARLDWSRNRRPPEAIVTQIVLTALAGLVVIWVSGLVGLPGRIEGRLAALAAWLLVCLAVAALIGRSYPHDRLGACNVVTMIRAALVCALLPPLLAGHPAGWPVAGLAALALALDGVDGWLARRSGLASDFGARFDVEVDAALALMLALHGLAGTPIGAEVLLLGVIRYGFVLAGFVWPWLAAPLPRSQRRRMICVMQMAVLIALLTPILPDEPAIWLVRAMALTLIWSFAVDSRWLWAARQR